MQRRVLLRQGGALAAGLVLARPGAARVTLPETPFALGVASGTPTHDSVVLWTRVLPPPALRERPEAEQTLPVRWELAHDAQFARMVQSGQYPAGAALGHSVHIEVTGLQSDRWYHYRFWLGDAVSTVGRTRTLPAPEAPVSRLRLAYASCQRWEHGYYGAYRHMRDDAPDLVLFLGDYIYEYPGAKDAVRKAGGGWVLTLDDYRQRYALHKSDPDLQAMHAACPWLLTWDDHEVQNDYAGIYPGDSGPAVPDFAARRAAAYQAYYENMPLPASVLTQGLAGLASGAEMRIYRQLQLGQLATLYLLDGRQYRDRQA
ncbi:MAG: alkaline phosphatase D family protein, partial [Rhodoferax sp.]